MSPISPSTALVDSTGNSASKSNLAKSKWKVLASAISQKNKIKNSKSNAEMLLRFPSYQVIHAQPLQDEDKSLLWFNITLPEFSSVGLKVRTNLDIFVKNYKRREAIFLFVQFFTFFGTLLSFKKGNKCIEKVYQKKGKRYSVNVRIPN